MTGRISFAPPCSTALSYFYPTSLENQSKINQLLFIALKGVVLNSSWLLEKGFSLQLQDRYKKVSGSYQLAEAL